ncbi:Uncharacterized protein TCM_045233 [Theobroma cacao]|uniref:Ubiquitin-like domain-containing protein n=1 Tax=Theobroma cacao TaxID=3641 RepID=A0A061FRA7_THECC|nr:Uncharacterized protein TCM_045233 [Theobroma cacao]
MLDCTQRLSVAFNSKKFLYNSSHINPISTVDHLKMEDEDIIDVIPWAKFKLCNLMLDYCDQTGVVFDDMRFLLNGSRMNIDKTADDLGLEDEELIEVFCFMLGGSSPRTVPTLDVKIIALNFSNMENEG